MLQRPRRICGGQEQQVVDPLAVVVVAVGSGRNRSCYLVRRCSRRSRHSRNLHPQLGSRRTLCKCLQNPMVAESVAVDAESVAVVDVDVVADETAAVEQSDRIQKTTFFKIKKYTS